MCIFLPKLSHGMLKRKKEKKKKLSEPTSKLRSRSYPSDTSGVLSKCVAASKADKRSNSPREILFGPPPTSVFKKASTQTAGVIHRGFF